jgi:hypothetical protein
MRTPGGGPSSTAGRSSILDHSERILLEKIDGGTVGMPVRAVASHVRKLWTSCPGLNIGEHGVVVLTVQTLQIGYRHVTNTRHGFEIN